MRILILLLLMSCSSKKVQIKHKPQETIRSKVYKCVVRLIEKNGVKPLDASKICNDIYRRKQ